MGEVNGAVARRATYPARDNLSSAGEHNFRYNPTSGTTEVIEEGRWNGLWFLKNLSAGIGIDDRAPEREEAEHAAGMPEHT